MNQSYVETHTEDPRDELSLLTKELVLKLGNVGDFSDAELHDSIENVGDFSDAELDGLISSHEQNRDAGEKKTEHLDVFKQAVRIHEKVLALKKANLHQS